MNLGHYRLLAQLGTASDGVSFRAEDVTDGATVEVRLLDEARADAARWPALTKRLRLAAMVQHPAALRVRELQPEHDPPFLALEWSEGTTLLGPGPLSPAQVAGLGRDLAGALAAAHRLGLHHGRLAPATVRGGWAAPKIDFTGLDTRPDDPRAAEFRRQGRAPEARAGGPVDAPADVYALGALLAWCLAGQPGVGLDGKIAGPLGELIRKMLADDPDERPTAREVENQLLAQPMPAEPGQREPASETIAGPSAALVTSETIAATSADNTATPRPSSRPAWNGEFPLDEMAREQLGRYRLQRRIGRGGMGAVYQAEDLADGNLVAIKVLRPELASRPESLRRFQKEARLLAEANNPHVTNLLEVNEDEGIHYLALEYVEGRSLGELLNERGKLDEPTALAIMADVARALVVAHERGIVHRDIKPENILLVESPAETVGLAPDGPTIEVRPPSVARVKLSDFGLARHIVESESLMVTQANAVVGTPAYMAPEQGSGGPIDARTDVYSMGVTLFHLLAGRPPFAAESLIELIAKHRYEPTPALQKLNPAISEGTSRVVDKALAKAPDARHPDAEALLYDLERLLRGEPTGVAVHPMVPDCDPRDVLEFDFRWDLEASPRQLWPLVSNTERLNRAIGLAAVDYITSPEPRGGSRRQAESRLGGLPAAWEEHPFEWVEPRRFGALRVYQKGPFKWFVNIVELTPRLGGGTTLVHRIRLEPRRALLRPVIALQTKGSVRRSLDRVYRRIDAAVSGKLGDAATVDPFEEPGELSPDRQRRLDQLLDVLIARGVHPSVAERLGEFLAHAPAQEVTRIRPVALARRLGLDPDGVVAACLHGAREGLLVLLWDLLCPVCRIPSEVKETLRALQDHGRCEACNLDYELDFANSVEMVFRAHPEVRDADLATYCIGGPAHSPHVVAQLRVAAGERVQLDLALTEGAYRLRGPQLSYAIDFRVQPMAATGRGALRLAEGAGLDFPRVLRAGGQVLDVTNDFDRETILRVERTAPRDDALTAARASALSLFRALFPGEVLSPGQLVSIANVTLVVADLAGAAALYDTMGDARAFTLLHQRFRRWDDSVRREGGALVKTLGEGMLAAFSDPTAAVRAALGLDSLDEPVEGLRLRVGIHRGAAMVATLNDHLDYFGAMVHQALGLLELAEGGDVIVTQAVASDPAVAALLQARGLEGEVLDIVALGGPFHRLRVDSPARRGSA